MLRWLAAVFAAGPPAAILFAGVHALDRVAFFCLLLAVVAVAAAAGLESWLHDRL